ncbi:MarR family winged helix-turn-helix transcriptional regulator [Phreatobacter sp.]|uniref:MarR family winged helix-turn-helix transcriptional regulator n=1 Tax=Phreatobacter sp. TaxID=1966341 RepID=UPI003F6EBB63
MGKATARRRKPSAERQSGVVTPAAARTDGWLDHGPLPGLVGYVLRRAQLAVFDDFIRSCDAHGLRPAQFSALVLIDANPGRSQREIAAALGIQRPNFVAMMDGFEKRGLARRRRSDTDRRSHALELTAAGRDLLDQAKATVLDHEARITGRLTSAEKAELLRLLEKI